MGKIVPCGAAPIHKICERQSIEAAGAVGRQGEISRVLRLVRFRSLGYLSSRLTVTF
jgi:hypothetical protein